MARWIDADKYYEFLRDDIEITGNSFRRAVDYLNSLKTVDAVEVVHGRWMEFNIMMTCSVCDKDWYYDDNNCDEFNYCPNCGAKMDGERRTNETDKP